MSAPPPPSTGQDDATASLPAPPAKRRRVAIACVMCRTRKSRCSGRRPRCSSCDYLGFTCTYESAADLDSPSSIIKAPPRRSLQQRLEVIESFLAQHADRDSLDAYAPGLLPSPGREDGLAENRSSVREDAPSNIQLNVATLQDAPVEGTGDVTDGMAVSFVDDRETAFFGASSNIAFSRQILHSTSSSYVSGGQIDKNAIHHKTNFSLNGLFEASRVPSPAAPKSAQPVSLESSLTLPPVADMEQLISSYFANTGLIFPFLHEATFWRAYEEFKSGGFSRVRRTWLGLLNIIMALASSTASALGPPCARDTAARIFYDRCIQICAIPVLRHSNIEVAQSLLLLVQYLQGTQMSVQAWGLHGLAVKACLSLGLHCTQLHSSFTSVELEMRKRTWFGCIALDRILSMTFGRPPLIPKQYIRLPLPQVWTPTPEHAHSSDGELFGGDDQALSTTFFSRTVDLYAILGTVIESVYGYNLESTHLLEDVDLVKHVVELDQSLEVWRTSVPDLLAVDFKFDNAEVDEQQNPLALRLRTILTLRFLVIKILTHRSLLVARLHRLSVERRNRKSLAAPLDVLITESISSCTQYAKYTIDIVYRALTTNQTGQGLLGAWWFTLHYVFTASLTLHGSLAVREMESADTGGTQLQAVDDENQTYLSRALETMHLLGRDNVTVNRCILYIESLRNAKTRLQEDAMSQPNDVNGLRSYHTSELGNLDFNSIVDEFQYAPEFGPYFAPELMDDSAFCLPLLS